MIEECIPSLTTEGKTVATTIDQQMNEFLNETFMNMREFEKENSLRSIQLFNEAMGKTRRCGSPVNGCFLFTYIFIFQINFKFA